MNISTVTDYLTQNYLTLGGYLSGQFTILQTLELLARILVSAICGASIGVEQSRRLKEAGMRTHVIVCCTAALMMVVSKYGFSDLTSVAGAAFYGTRGADPARIAAQVVSGVSFLGAGAIFKSGNSIRGLTTAAGIWATAGVGLTIGSGMYSVGVGFTVILIILQLLMHRIGFGTDLTTHHLVFSLIPEKNFRDSFDTFLDSRHAQVAESEVSYSETDGLTTYKLVLKCPHGVIQEVDDFLHTHGEVYTVSYSNIA